MTTSPQAPPPGLTVDGYTLLTRIGEGGMGVVHLAQRPGEARVALKVIRPHIVGDDEARRRLAREVGSLSRIRSRWVAEIVDADPWGDIPYVATRYVPGLSLHDHVAEEGPITGPDLVWFARCLAEALRDVHAYGVLHRDVKPSNVLMEGRSPILIDFGLARVADDPRLTHTGWLLGTPGYLAPEILHGQDATAASDVHSWGATVAFAGTGNPPFGRGPSMAIMDRVRRGEHRLDGLPEPVRSVVAAALDPDPSRRPSLAEILARLGDPTPARAPVPAPADDPFTLPLAVAASARSELTTGVVPSPYQTRAYTDVAPAPAPYAVPGALPPGVLPTGALPPWAYPPPAPLPRAVRARRSVVLLLGLAAAALLVAAFPYVGSGLLLLAAWLLRSGSLAASAAGNRRFFRGGKRWYDAPQLLLATPWHLVQSIPGTFMLLCWAVGLATAGALLAYALSLSLTWSLVVIGAAYSFGLWIGPGGRRVRSPVDRVLVPACRSNGSWLVALLIVAGIGLTLGAQVVTWGPTWSPASQRPFAGVDVPGV